MRARKEQPRDRCPVISKLSSEPQEFVPLVLTKEGGNYSLVISVGDEPLHQCALETFF